MSRQPSSTNDTRIRELYLQGLTIAQVGSVTGINVNSVYSALKRLGTPMRKRGSRNVRARPNFGGSRCLPRHGYCPTAHRLLLEAEVAPLSSSLGASIDRGRHYARRVAG